MLLIALFAAVALVLTLVGVYGVVSYAVAQRTREFGLRAALGARAGDILRMVLKQAAVLIAIGLAAGLCGAFALSRYLGTLLFEVTPHDLTTFSAVTLLLFALFPAFQIADEFGLEGFLGGQNGADRSFFCDTGNDCARSAARVRRNPAGSCAQTMTEAAFISASPGMHLNFHP